MSSPASRWSSTRWAGRFGGSNAPFHLPLRVRCCCAYWLGGRGRRIGLYGFGASARIVAQVARWQGRELFAFTRPGDSAGQDFARSLGCMWAGGSDEMPPEPLDAGIFFAAVGALVPAALKAVR